MTRIYVPGDTAAVAAGADEVANAVAAQIEAWHAAVEIVRTGSRGMTWLEPLVEVETPAGRVGYGPIEPADVPDLLGAALAPSPGEAGPAHPKAIGLVDAHPWLARQTRLTFARCGIVDPGSLKDFCAQGGLRGLYRAVEIGPAATLGEIVRSGLRGLGGGGLLPAGAPWNIPRGGAAGPPAVTCHAAPRETAGFADGMLLEGDPFGLIEGMMIAGFAVGAAQGFVHAGIGENRAIARFAAALETARAAGLLGPRAPGAGFSFDIALRIEGGPTAPDEETVLSDSPVTLATLPAILAEGAERFAALGARRSRGTVPIQLAGNVRRGGLFEAGFGLTLAEIVEDIGGGSASGRPVRAVQCGGTRGTYVPPSLFGTPYDHEASPAGGGLVGNGGVIVFDESVDLARLALSALRTCAADGCGCTPCRVGSARGIGIIERIVAGDGRPETIELLEDLCQTMAFGSRCASGRLTPAPVLSALRHFPQDFGPAPFRMAAE